MKIAVNIQPMLHSNKSGIGYYQQELIRGLLGTDVSDSFLLQYFDLRGLRENVSAVFGTDRARDEVCRWFSATLYQLIWTFLPVPYRLFFRERPDVSMFFNYYLPPGVRGKRILTVYDTVIKDHPETMSFKTRTMLDLTLEGSIKRADKIITISQFSKSRIMKHYGVPEEKIAVIPCAADSRRFHPVENRAESLEKLKHSYGIGDDYFLYLGNLEPRKNLTRLIEAYADVRSRREELPQLVIAGGKGWQYEEIFARVKQLELSDDVIFTGYVDDDFVPQLMGCARAFCFPSLYEGFGMPPLEAMSCGVPVIVSGTTSLPEVAGECGISVDPLDVGQISDALIQMCDDGFCAEQSRLGIERSKEFSWEKSAAALMDVIREICQ